MCYTKYALFAGKASRYQEDWLWHQRSSQSKVEMRHESFWHGFLVTVMGLLFWHGFRMAVMGPLPIVHTLCAVISSRAQLVLLLLLPVPLAAFPLALEGPTLPSAP